MRYLVGPLISIRVTPDTKFRFYTKYTLFALGLREHLLHKWAADMKNVVIGAIVCIAVLYGVDALYFNGKYANALSQTTSEIILHFR